MAWMPVVSSWSQLPLPPVPKPVSIHHLHATKMVKGATLLITRSVVVPPKTNFTYYAGILIPYQIQESTDLSNWVVLTNIWFPLSSFTVPNNGANMFFRGFWTNAPQPLITTN